MAVNIFSEDNFTESVLNSEKPVLVDFWASWCGPCRMLAPVVEELSDEHPEIVFGKVNVDECPELAMRYNISSIPALLLFRGGEPVDRTVGVQPKEALELFIK